MQYHIVAVDHTNHITAAAELNRVVNIAIDNGWKPVLDVIAIQHKERKWWQLFGTHRITLMQPMVKENSCQEQ